jgi:hypothetical protein
MHSELIQQLERQNRLLKRGLAGAGLALVLTCIVGAKAKEERVRFAEIDVERINIVNADGTPAVVLANRTRLPQAIQDGKVISSDRGQMPGLIFYNAKGDELGGLIFDGKLDANGKPRGGMHLSMDRFGGDQQLALRHEEGNGFMETGMEVLDRGLYNDYAPLYEAFQKAPPGAEKDALKKRWQDAGGQQTRRLFVGRTRGKSSAVILADAHGNPRIMMLVTPEGKPMLNFIDDKGEVIQSLPEFPKADKQARH